MAIYFTSPLVYLIILNFSISIVLLSESQTLVLNLIHSKHIKETYVARLDYLKAKTSRDIIAHISPNVIPTGFLANISIGSPPITQLLHMDTGSDLTWLQCRPCTNCYHQSIPIFDPSRSKTYSNEFGSCRNFDYYMPNLHFNRKTRSCDYTMEYVDGTGSRGTLVKETLMFNTMYSESSSASLPNVALGCGHDNYGEPQLGNGILGLGYGRLSLVHRFGSKFSYCFGSLYDPSYTHNVLVLGDDGANVLGDTTQLEIQDNFYYVRIEAISVDGTLLHIDPLVFQRNYKTGLGGTIIDTGTTLTSLVREAYEQLKNQIEYVFEGRFTKADMNGKMVCYNGDFERDLVDSGFPIITFHFTDGAELSLDVKSLFLKDDSGVFCLAVTPSIGRDLSIIGALAQQSYNIGYDLKAMKVSFERIDCSVLFDY